MRCKKPLAPLLVVSYKSNNVNRNHPRNPTPRPARAPGRGDAGGPRPRRPVAPAHPPPHRRAHRPVRASAEPLAHRLPAPPPAGCPAPDPCRDRHAVTRPPRRIAPGKPAPAPLSRLPLRPGSHRRGHPRPRAPSPAPHPPHPVTGTNAPPPRRRHRRRVQISAHSASCLRIGILLRYRNNQPLRRYKTGAISSGGGYRRGRKPDWNHETKLSIE